MSKHFELPRLNRRRFVQGLAAGGILAGMPSLGRAASAGHTQHGTAPVLSGKTIDLVIDETLVNFTGNIRRATSINGQS